MIHCVYWDSLPSTSGELPVASSWCVHVIWPSPIDSDACFQRAGFTEFADSNDEWDSEWRAIVNQTIAVLSRTGTPAIRKPIVPVTENRLMSRLRKWAPKYKDVVLPLAEQVVLATMDDQFGHAIVDFGKNGAAALLTGDGHPLLWIHSEPEIDIGEIVNRIGERHSIAQRTLDWSILKPPRVSV